MTAPGDVLMQELGLTALPADYRPRFNVAPTQPAPVITHWTDRELEMFRWGLIPSWVRDPSIGNQLINARAETAATKSSFRDAFARRRCLVVADGFYEWRRQGSNRVPMYVRCRSKRPFCFAGLWEGWLAPSGDLIRTFTILTTEASASIAAIHPRMPVILGPEARERWIDPSQKDVDQLQALLTPYPDDEIEAYPVSPRVNSPRNDDADLIAHCEPRGTLPLFPD